MALKADALMGGLKKGIRGEEQKARSRFDIADAVLEDRPGGLGNPKTPKTKAPGEKSFTGERKLTPPIETDRYVISAPIDSVDDNPYNARVVYQPERVSELSGSIKAHGQKVPANAMLHPTLPGRYVLIDGHYRKQALKAAGRDSMDLVLEQPLSHLELYRVSYLVNHDRKPQSVLDNALAWKRLLDDKVIDKEEALVSLTGQSSASVSKTLAVLRLPDSAVLKMREQPEAFGLSIAYELTLIHKASNDDTTLGVIDRILQDGLSRRDVEAIRKQLETPRARKKKEVSRQYKLHGAKGQAIGFIKEWDSGKVVLEVRLEDGKERGRLLELLKDRFKVEGGQSAKA